MMLVVVVAIVAAVEGVRVSWPQAKVPSPLHPAHTFRSPHAKATGDEDSGLEYLLGPVDVKK